MSETNPLPWQVPIVNPNGTPTKHFMQQWQAQRQTNADIPALENVFVNTASPLTGGGSLGKAVLTLGLGIVALISMFTSGNVSALLDVIGATRGSILYRGASGWAILTPGTAGQVLTSQGAGADPHWA
jgi:hypothetical protein